MKAMRVLVGFGGLGLIAALGLALGACGSEATSGEQDGEQILHATLTEWSVASGHDGAAEFPTVAAGETTFEVHNGGATAHEQAVIRTDADLADLPLDGAVVDEAAAGELIGRTHMIPAGGVEVLQVDLEPGTYALVCNVPGHYQQGMFAELIVE